MVRRISPVRYRVRSVAGEDVWSVRRERGATSTNPFLRFRRTRPRRESDGVSASSMRSWDGRPCCRTCCRREITPSRASEGATGPAHKPAPPLPEKAECIGAVRPATDRFLWQLRGALQTPERAALLGTRRSRGADEMLPPAARLRREGELCFYRDLVGVGSVLARELRRARCPG